MGVVGQGCVAVVADLKPLLVIAAAAVGRALDIAELNFMVRILRTHIHRELDFQQAVQLVPLDGGIELGHRAVCAQRDGLRDGGMADIPGPSH